MAEIASQTTDQNVSQVRIQLQSPDKDISLPENIGSILVNTSKVSDIPFTLKHIIHHQTRPPPLCPLDARQCPAGKRAAHPLRIPHQRHLSPHHLGRVPHRQWHLIRKRSEHRVRPRHHPAPVPRLHRRRRLDKLRRCPLQHLARRAMEPISPPSEPRIRAYPLGKLRWLPARLGYVAAAPWNLRFRGPPQHGRQRCQVAVTEPDRVRRHGWGRQDLEACRV